MKILNIFIFIIIVLFSSCRTIKINYGTRNIVYPGIKTGKTSMSYKVEFKSNTDFRINKILLENDLIKRYSIQNSETKVFEDVNKNNFKKGVYKIIFKTFDVYKDNKNNMVTIVLEQNNKNKTIKIPVINTKDKHRK